MQQLEAEHLAEELGPVAIAIEMAAEEADFQHLEADFDQVDLDAGHTGSEF